MRSKFTAEVGDVPDTPSGLELAACSDGLRRSSAGTIQVSKARARSATWLMAPTIFAKKSLRAEVPEIARCE
ncbi:hypothetical protein [Kribbella sancticallisti]|uniref:hypothetical protein n=1 Tax=Kribbella sancticallisti TaxID=460087 RepID=UPI0031D34E50